MKASTLKSPEVINYMLRHLLTVNITDLLSNASREYSNYKQYFSGTNLSGQINYLERKPTDSGRFIIKISGVEKTDGVDYDLDRTNLTITWTGTTPASGSDNVLVDYQAVKPWIYDDSPVSSMGASHFPRITVDNVFDNYEVFAMGEYHDYNSGTGNLITARVNVIVRVKRTDKHYTELTTYKDFHYKNMDLCNAISEEIINYVKTNRLTPPWKFYDWEVVRAERNRNEEDGGIYRKDISWEVKYFDKS